jgi:glyoxylase-like metal-dependent hydrolase (beta-lactamase superfamily II)
VSEKTYELYGVKFAENPAGTRGHYFYGRAGEPHDAPAPIDYNVFVIRGEDGDIVVDAGFTAETAQTALPRPHFENPSEAVRRVGVDPEQVKTLVLTHIHIDHTGDLAAFPNAEIVLQEAEMAYWTGRPGSRQEISRHVLPRDVATLVELNFAGRIRWVRGDTLLADGLSLHLVAGHTPGSQAVRVRTADGWFVLAGDAAHYYEEVHEHHPFAVFADLPGMYDSFERLVELAGGDVDRVVPGHDPLMFNRFAAVSPHEGRVFRVA